MEKRTLVIVTIALIITLSCVVGMRARGESNRLDDISNDYYKAIAAIISNTFALVLTVIISAMSFAVIADLFNV